VGEELQIVAKREEFIALGGVTDWRIAKRYALDGRMMFQEACWDTVNILRIQKNKADKAKIRLWYKITQTHTSPNPKRHENATVIPGLARRFCGA
jgi:hypothetical protein